MRNIVSFQTATRLKAAGFPQPEYAFGQFWYSETQGPCVCVRHKPDNRRRISSVCYFIQDDGRDWMPEEIEMSAYAPTGTDILQEFYPQFGDRYFNTRLECMGTEGLWFVLDRLGQTDTEGDENPAEAAAAAWLKMKGA